MRKLIIILTFLFIILSHLNMLGIQNNLMKNKLHNELENTNVDTTKIKLLNDLAHGYYNSSKIDSCVIYASIALKFADSLLNNNNQKKDSKYISTLKILKANSLINIGSALRTKNPKTALESLHSALNIMTYFGKKNEMARIYFLIGDAYDAQNRNHESLQNYQKSMRLYEELDSIPMVGLLNLYSGIVQRYMGNYGDALESQIRALEIGKQVDESNIIIESLLAMGFTYMFVEKWDEALLKQNEALKLYKQIKDSLGISTVYSDMGVVNMSAGNLDEALKNHTASLLIRQKLNDNYSIASSCFYIGKIYEKQGNFKEALSYYSKSHKYAQLSRYKRLIITANIDLGLIYMKLSDNEKALKHFFDALEISKEDNNQLKKTEALTNIAQIYLNKGDLWNAIQWFQKAKTTAPASSFSELMLIYKQLSLAYTKINNYQKAYSNLLLFNQMKDSVIVAENLEKITTLSNRLEFENRQALQNESHSKMMQIKESEIKRQKVVRNFSLFGFFVVLVLAIIAFIRFVEKNKLNSKLNNTLSKLKSTQSQLIYAEKMASLGELTAGIAHEIKNPLNFINNFSELSVELVGELEEELTTFIKNTNNNSINVDNLLKDLKVNSLRINQHGKRADNIIKSMLLHSRGQSGIKQYVDINSILEEDINLAYHGFRAKDSSFNIIIEKDFDLYIGKILLVHEDISRVFLNILNNGFYAVSKKKSKAGNEYKPYLKIQSKGLIGNIEIRIKDNGCGIPEELRDKLFNPFFTTKPAGEGTGLGLSLSYDTIVKQHSGKIKFESKTGEYTEFIITLPKGELPTEIKNS